MRRLTKKQQAYFAKLNAMPETPAIAKALSDLGHAMGFGGGENATDQMFHLLAEAIATHDLTDANASHKIGMGWDYAHDLALTIAGIIDERKPPRKSKG